MDKQQHELKVGDWLVWSMECVQHMTLGNMYKVLEIDSSDGTVTILNDLANERKYSMYRFSLPAPVKPQRRHADLIKAWADGADIEVRNSDGRWSLSVNPIFLENFEYRIKQAPKPNIAIYGHASYTFGSERALVENLGQGQDRVDNIRLIFCGDTGKLLSVQII